MLSIIIPFINEGAEVEKTVASIKATATGSPDIILVNDGSTDGYAYRAVAERYGCRYVEHAERWGVAASRDHGVKLAETAYVLLLDAHMEMYGRGWDARIAALLASHQRVLLCAQTVSLSANRAVKRRSTCEGACVDYAAGIRARWSVARSAGNQHGNLCEVECVLGAAYAMRKDYYDLLHGLQGLRSYGADEEFLSAKVRWSGGRCLLVKDWIAGHIYRSGNTAAPFVHYAVDGCYNRILIAELLYTGAAQRQLLGWIEQRYKEVFPEAYSRVMASYGWVAQERAYLWNIFEAQIPSGCQSEQRQVTNGFRGKKMKGKVVYNTWLGWMADKLGYGAITIAWFIFPRAGKTSLSERLLNHERIHIAQQVEMGFLLQWLWYGAEYLIRLARYRNHDKAYRNTSFEHEAYDNEKNFEYLKARRRWAWVKYL
jgi:glycosyltransferase involved in cell wall biosynthesis